MFVFVQDLSVDS